MTRLHQRTAGCTQVGAALRVPGVLDSCWSPGNRWNTPGKKHHTLSFTHTQRCNYRKEGTCHRLYAFQRRSRYLLAVRGPEGQIVQAVQGHVPDPIEQPDVSDQLHAQLPGREEENTRSEPLLQQLYSILDKWLAISLFPGVADIFIICMILVFRRSCVILMGLFYCTRVKCTGNIHVTTTGQHMCMLTWVRMLFWGHGSYFTSHLLPYLFGRVHAEWHALQLPPWQFFSK